MKKTSFMITACILLFAFLLTGCSNSPAEKTTSAESSAQAETTQAETTQAAPLDDEIVKLSTMTLNDYTFQLPAPFEEFAKKSGFGFKNSETGNYTDETELPAYTTLSLVYKIDTGYLYLLVANQTSSTIKAKDGEVIGIKLTRTSKEDFGAKINYCGVKWDTPYKEILQIHGDADKDETNKNYHLIGYTKKRDSNSNISYSFVADSEKLYSFAISVDNLAITYGSLDAQKEEKK